MSLPTLALPSLDGTRPATDARLTAWLGDDQTALVEDALHTVKAHIDEALAVIPGLASMEECDNECCTKGGDVEYLGDELGKGREGLRVVEQRLQDALSKVSA